MPSYIGVDSGGFYDFSTGEPVRLAYDESSGYFYNALTGESAELLGDAINAARDSLIGIFGRQGYPQSQRSSAAINQQQLIRQQQSGSPGTFNAAGISLKWYTLVAIGAGVALIFTGKRLR